MSRSVPLATALDDAMLALYQIGERPRPSNGYPMRLLLPGYVGNMNVKWSRRIKLTEGPMMTKDQTSKYTISLPTGKLLQFESSSKAMELESDNPDASTSVREICYLLLAVQQTGRSMTQPVVGNCRGLAAVRNESPAVPQRRYRPASISRASAIGKRRARRDAQAACPASSPIKSWRISISTCGRKRRSPCIGTV
jgi:DMSO/TMAO reductase YedYZ molybdopterin-dependent catalytic subunit